MNNTGEKIRFLRKEKNWSLDELSRRSGVPKSTIWGIEKGSQTSYFNLVKIAAALSVSVKSIIPPENELAQTVYELQTRDKFLEEFLTYDEMSPLDNSLKSLISTLELYFKSKNGTIDSDLKLKISEFEKSITHHLGDILFDDYFKNDRKEYSPEELNKMAEDTLNKRL